MPAFVLSVSSLLIALLSIALAREIRTRHAMQMILSRILYQMECISLSGLENRLIELSGLLTFSWDRCTAMRVK